MDGLSEAEARWHPTLYFRWSLVAGQPPVLQQRWYRDLNDLTWRDVPIVAAEADAPRRGDFW